MKKSSDIFFPYYSGNIRFTKCQGYLTLNQFIKKHKKPNDETLKTMKQIQVADGLNFKKLKRKLKQKLVSFTPSVFIYRKHKRKYDNVVCFTGLMQLDFDKIDSKELAIDLKEYLFNNYKFIICSYLSPSGLGVKCLMKIKVPKNKEEYKLIHNAVTKEFETIDYFDPATTNAMLPLFLSYDPDILYRDYSECDTWDKTLDLKIDYKQLNDKATYNVNRNSNDFEKITCRIFINKFSSIVDNGHTQLRSACLILGSRVGAGYIDRVSAEEMAFAIIRQTPYFSKDLNNYLSTAKWCIDQGINNPKYYK